MSFHLSSWISARLWAQQERVPVRHSSPSHPQLSAITIFLLLGRRAFWLRGFRTAGFDTLWQSARAARVKGCSKVNIPKPKVLKIQKVLG